MTDKVAYITGVTSGIGEASARLLIKRGWRVVGTGRRIERIEALKKEFGESQFLGQAFDMNDDSARREALAALPDRFRNVDLLVNNAGLALGTDPAHLIDWSDWSTMMQTNIIALSAITHALLPTLVKQAGIIVNMGSVAGTYPYHGGNVYGATKAFVHQFSLGLRCDLRGTGVRISSIEPGMVETEFSAVRRRSVAAAAELYKNTTSLSADNIAQTILWIAEQPLNVNINIVELMPTDQSFAGFHIERRA